MSLKAIYQSIKKVATPERAAKTMYFFKTKPGQYGQGDVFVGISNPEARNIAKINKNIQYHEVQKLVNSKVHEQRLIGLLVLVQKFKIEQQKNKVYQFYLNHLNAVNNWDLVDLSAPQIIGSYLLETGQSREILYNLSKSKSLWQRRIAILSTHPFIKIGEFQDTFNISRILLDDKQDLIHKGVGWMLRQVGNKNCHKLEVFLKQNYKNIPRTALRYAIQKFQEEKRQKYLKAQF